MAALVRRYGHLQPQIGCYVIKFISNNKKKYIIPQITTTNNLRMFLFPISPGIKGKIIKIITVIIADINAAIRMPIPFFIFPYQADCKY
jgi:hypothetical protein